SGRDHDAGCGSEDGRAVLLCRSRVAGSSGPSVAEDPRGGECEAPGDVGGLRRALLTAWAAGSSSAAAAGVAAPAMLLFVARGAAADGAAGVRPAVPLVRGSRGR